MGDKLQPWATPCSTLNNSDFFPSKSTPLLDDIYILFLNLVKEYIIDVWEIRKHKLYDSDLGHGRQLHFRSSPGERNGKFS